MKPETVTTWNRGIVAKVEEKHFNELDQYNHELYDAWWAHPGTAHEALENTKAFTSGWGNPIIGVEDHGDEIIVHLHVLVDSATGGYTGSHPHDRYTEVTEVRIAVSEFDQENRHEYELYEEAIPIVLKANKEGV